MMACGMLMTRRCKPTFEQLLDPRVTILLMGYSPRRIGNYRSILRSYSAMTSEVARVVVIWNNNLVAPPDVPADVAKCVQQGSCADVQVIQAANNSMNNRYLLVDNVATDVVLTIDDDQLMREELLAAMLLVWRSNPHRLVGLDRMQPSLFSAAFLVLGQHGI